VIEVFKVAALPVLAFFRDGEIQNLITGIHSLESIQKQIHNTYQNAIS
jgi:hypothetical protein